MDFVARNVGSARVSWLLWDNQGGTLHIFLKGQGDLDLFKQETANLVSFYPSAGVSAHVALHEHIERVTGLVNSLDLPHEHMCNSVAGSGEPGGGLNGNQLASVLLVLMKKKFITGQDFAAFSSAAE